MKTSLRKLVATVSGLAIAAVLPMASMMASAEGVELSLTADKTTVAAGDTVKLSLNVAGLDGEYLEEAQNLWNVLEYNVAYDGEQVTPVQQRPNGGRPVDFGSGAALVDPQPTIQVNLKTNPVLVGAIDAEGQYGNGEVMNIAFEVADDVAAGDKITLTVNISQFAKAVIVDNKAQDPLDLVAPDSSYTVELTVEGGEPTQPTESQPTETQPTETQPTESKPTESQPTESKPTDDTNTSDTDDTNTSDTDDTNTSDTDGTGTSDTDDTGVVTPSASGDDAQPTLPSVDGGDVTIPGGGSGSGAGTGESTVLFVVALVLMAGSAAALVVMKKKKVFSK